MSDSGDAAAQGDGFLSSAWGAAANMGSAAWSYAASTVNSIISYGELNVVDPNAGEATNAETDLSDKRQKHFTSYKDYLGKDITSLVILPVWIMQPFTMLQNMAEIMEYTDCLDKAAVTEDPHERLAWVVAFTMGPFAAVERPWKPFNPILGETFEFHKNDKGIHYIAEQVSHHPPVGVSHAESDLWSYGLVSAPKTKFLGNSVEVYPVGRTRIQLKATGETFSLVPPPAKAHNIIVGATWIESAGDYSLVNATTGAAAHIHFTPCGWFGAGRYEMAGHVKDEDGVPVLALSGKWNSHLDCVACDPSGEALPDAEVKRLWTCRERPVDDPYSFTHFAHELNSCSGVNPLPSDSRRRPDRALLELGQSGDAAVAKHSLEEMQRAERREREARGEAWAPRWFKAASAEGYELLQGEFSLDECPAYEFTGEWLKMDPRPECPEEEVQGKGFSPWSFPDIHAKLGKETERG